MKCIFDLFLFLEYSIKVSSQTVDSSQIISKIDYRLISHFRYNILKTYHINPTILTKSTVKQKI